MMKVQFVSKGVGFVNSQTREVNLTAHEVVDVFREGKLALVLCVHCKAVWEEGEMCPPPCSESLKGFYP